MTTKEKKYELKLDLNVLKHLGFNLYSNTPAVISEVVANAYDADAEKIEITLTPQEITIQDDGHGMSLDDINKKFLSVGYARREKGEEFSREKKRPVMGRKGIGKLSLFSIANNIKIYTASIDKNTGEKSLNGFELNKTAIENDIKEGINHNPKNLDTDLIQLEKGTKIIISDFKKRFNRNGAYLRKRLARRFSVIGQDFEVIINQTPITINDRDFFKSIDFIWLIGDYQAPTIDNHDFEKENKLPGIIYSNSENDYKIKGWIGSVSKPSDLINDSTNNNKISILIRGKMAQEDILNSHQEGGIYADYLIGEIHADFLDENNKEDIATSSRQNLNEDDDRYNELNQHINKLLKNIQRQWTKLRKDLKEKEALENLSSPLQKWFDSLENERSKAYAKKLFGTIESLHFVNEQEANESKRELYKSGIIAFEKLKLKGALEDLDKITNQDHLKLTEIFNSISDIEAHLYYDIAKERLAIIKKLELLAEENAKESVLQEHLFDNLWLLNPAWDRATKGGEYMEKQVLNEFSEIDAKLTPEEKRGRIDIKYRSAAGAHIIVELKRYSTSYTLTATSLYNQVKKYKKALSKCLKAVGKGEEPIKCIVVVGKISDEIFNETQELLDVLNNSRIIRYNTLIQQSIESYQNYIDTNTEINKIQDILDQI